jgi:hypothetical protein
MPSSLNPQLLNWPGPSQPGLAEMLALNTASYQRAETSYSVSDKSAQPQQKTEIGKMQLSPWDDLIFQGRKSLYYNVTAILRFPEARVHSGFALVGRKNLMRACGNCRLAAGKAAPSP